MPVRPGPSYLHKPTLFKKSARSSGNKGSFCYRNSYYVRFNPVRVIPFKWYFLKEMGTFVIISSNYYLYKAFGAYPIKPKPM
jgi:hypothetical protein